MRAEAEGRVEALQAARGMDREVMLRSMLGEMEAGLVARQEASVDRFEVEVPVFARREKIRIRESKHTVVGG